jgi:hypothetical protein
VHRIFACPLLLQLLKSNICGSGSASQLLDQVNGSTKILDFAATYEKFSILQYYEFSVYKLYDCCTCLILSLLKCIRSH